MKALILLFIVFGVLNPSKADLILPESSQTPEYSQNYISLSQETWGSSEELPDILSLFPEYSQIRNTQNKYIFNLADFDRHFRLHQQRITLLMLELKRKFPKRYAQITEEDIYYMGKNHDRAKLDKSYIKDLYLEYLRIQKVKVTGFIKNHGAEKFSILAFETLAEELSSNQVFRQHFPTDSHYSFFAREGGISAFKVLIAKGLVYYQRLPENKRSVPLEIVNKFIEELNSQSLHSMPSQFFSENYLKNFTVSERLFVFFGIPYHELPILLKWKLHNLIHFLNFADNHFTLQTLKNLGVASGHSFESARMSKKAELLLEMEQISDKVDRAMDPVAAHDEFRRKMEPASAYLRIEKDKAMAAELEKDYKKIVKGFAYEDYVKTAPKENCIDLLLGQIVY